MESINCEVFPIPDMRTQELVPLLNCSKITYFIIQLLTPFIFCVLILWRGTYILKSTPNDKFLRSFSRQFYFLSEILQDICWEEVTEQNILYFAHIPFCWRMARNLTHGLTPNKPTQ